MRTFEMLDEKHPVRREEETTVRREIRPLGLESHGNRRISLQCRKQRVHGACSLPEMGDATILRRNHSSRTFLGFIQMSRLSQSEQPSAFEIHTS